MTGRTYSHRLGWIVFVGLFPGWLVVYFCGWFCAAELASCISGQYFNRQATLTFPWSFLARPYVLIPPPFISRSGIGQHIISSLKQIRMGWIS